MTLHLINHPDLVGQRLWRLVAFGAATYCPVFVEDTRDISAEHHLIITDLQKQHIVQKKARMATHTHTLKCVPELLGLRYFCLNLLNSLGCC